MKVRSVQPFAGPGGPVQPGDVVEVDDGKGTFLLRHGFAKEHGDAVAAGRQRGSARTRRPEGSASPLSAPPKSQPDDGMDQNGDEGAPGKA